MECLCKGFYIYICMPEQRHEYNKIKVFKKKKDAADYIKRKTFKDPYYPQDQQLSFVIIKRKLL